LAYLPSSDAGGCPATAQPLAFYRQNTYLFGSCLKGVDTGLIVVHDEEFGDQVVVFKFS
jgi:hypothetical protein